MIRVPIPIDIGTIAATDCGVFACATPLRVERLLALAVLEALGPRAPQDKRARAVRTTLAGFFAGLFTIEVDGRIFSDPAAIVMCGNVATLRFFSKRGSFAA